MARKLPQAQTDITPLVRSPADLGRVVRNARAVHGVRIDDAAHLAGVSSDLVSRLENGKAVTTDRLLALLDTLGLSLLVLPRAQAARILSQRSTQGPADGDDPR